MSCPLPPGIQDLSIHGTQHMTLLYIASACLGFIGLSQFAQILLYLSRYRLPEQQRQIIRILFMPVVFAIISWAQIYNYQIANYIEPIGSFYEAFALCALYLLFCHYSEIHDVEAGNHAKLSEPLPQQWLFVFQYPVVELIAIIILEATSAKGIYCAQSLDPQYGHLWYQIISSIGLTLCVLAILRFFRVRKHAMTAKRPIAKIICFKGVIFLNFLQSWIFSGLVTHGDLAYSSEWSYGDYVYGLPNVLFIVEMVIFSIGFWFAYPVSDYHCLAESPRSMSFLMAILDALSLRDFVDAYVRALEGLRVILQERRERRQLSSTRRRGHR